MKINPYNRTEQGRPSSRPAAETGRSSAGRALDLTPGQLLKGTVVRAEEGGRVLIAVDQELIAARTPLHLAEGSEHWLEVRRGGTEPWLALAGRKGAAGELLRLLAAAEAGRGKFLELLLGGGLDHQELSPAAASLLQDLAGLLAESAVGGEADPARVILGLLLLREPPGRKEEGLLRGRLADFLTALPEEAAARKEGEALARFLAALEEVHGQPAAAGERFLLAPCLLAGGAGWGEWLLTPDDSGEKPGGEAGYELSFFLRLSRLGELHLQLAVRGEAIRGSFAVTDGGARRHLEANLPDLTGLFERLGFEKIDFSCRQSERHHLQKLEESLRRRAGLAPLALVDLQA